MNLLLYAAVLLCASGAVALVLRHDLHDREPPLTVALALLIGFLATPVLGRIEDALLFALTPLPPLTLVAAAAAVVEEGSRALLVTLFALCDRRRFNDPMDGIVYGSLLGVGMAIFETFLYVGGDPVPLEGTLAREAVRIYGHLILGGIAGYAAGALRTGRRTAPLAMALCPLLAMALHFLLDLGSLTVAIEPGGEAAGTALALVAVVAATLLHGGLTVLASERSRLLFDPGSARRLVGWPLDLLARGKGPGAPPPGDAPPP